MTNAITTKALDMLTFLKENEGTKMTADFIAEGLGISSRSVTGSVNGLAKRGYAERVPGQIKLEDDTVKAINFIQITDAGKAYDHAKATAADEAEAAAKAAEKAAKAE